MPEERKRSHKKRKPRWWCTREGILMASGLAIILAEFINAEVVGGSFHYEFLIVGVSLCGVSITQWKDRS